MGYPNDFTDLSYPPRVGDDYVGAPDVQDKDAFAARVHGDSMAPKNRAGDIVIFSPALAPRSGDDCFVRFENGEATFKRVFFEGDRIRLQPLNKSHPTVRIRRTDHITGIYAAVYQYQSVRIGGAA